MYINEDNIEEDIRLLEREIAIEEEIITNLENRLVYMREQLRALQNAMVKLKAMRLAQKFDKPGA